MSVDAVDRVVRALVVGLMNGVLYFAEHRRVGEAAEKAAQELKEYFADNPRLEIEVREGLLCFEGKPLYDLSLYANRLITILRDHEALGVRFDRGVSGEEIQHLFRLVLDSRTKSATEINQRLSQQAIMRVGLIEAAMSEDREEVEEVEDERLAIDDQELSREAYGGALNALQEIMLELRRQKKASFGRANEMAEGIAKSMSDHKTPFVALTAAKEYDTYTFNHSVNVCVYATALAESITTNPHEVVQIAQAALLHDVGKILITDEILFKAGALSDAEWRIMRQHPVLGSKILMAAGGVNELAVNVAYGHHVRHDQKGYPETGGGLTVDSVTEMVNVIDVYEAVTAVRPYKKPFTPERAADLLIQGAGSEFNPIWVDAFLSYFGVYPVGTRVSLEDGSEGQVVSTNPQDPFRPVVRISHDPYGQRVRPQPIVDTARCNASGVYEHTIVSSQPVRTPALQA